MKSHFHMKRWAPRLALRKRLKVIRKWPIEITSYNNLHISMTPETVIELCEEYVLTVIVIWAVDVTNKNVDSKMEASSSKYLPSLLASELPMRTSSLGLKRIGHVRYINILTWLRGFQVKHLYLVLLSLYPSLF